MDDMILTIRCCQTEVSGRSLQLPRNNINSHQQSSTLGYHCHARGYPFKFKDGSGFDTEIDMKWTIESEWRICILILSSSFMFNAVFVFFLLGSVHFRFVSILCFVFIMYEHLFGILPYAHGIITSWPLFFFPFILVYSSAKNSSSSRMSCKCRLACEDTFSFDS